MKRLHFIACTLWLLLANTAAAQSTPFSRGVNLTNWFQAGNAQAIPFNRYTRRDFEQIRNLGADAIRLPMNLHYMTSGAPDYTLDPLFLSYLDQVVDWAEALEMHLIIDNHTFDPSVSTDPNVGEILNKVWLQMAGHYKDRSGFIYYEVMNEPHGISDEVWNAIQQEVVETIRSVDQAHTIVIGPAGWNSYQNLEAMPVYDDDNLIYTFHFYDPFLFSHQGATWGSPSMGELAGVPFPYDADRMPPLPESLEGSWVADAYARYDTEGTVAEVQRLLDIAIQFRADRGVPIWLGELGILMNNADPADRVYWHQVVREYLDQHEVSWTLWDYHGGFGVFLKGSGGQYGHDLNVDLLESLGFNVPPQTEYEQVPESASFDIYIDDAAGGAVLYGSNAGLLESRSADRPFEDNRSIRWSGPGGYGAIGFDFQLDIDLQFLFEQGYGLELAVRGDAAIEGLSVRFVDSDTEDPDDRPWRMGFDLDSARVNWDGQWHSVFVPLADMLEQGAWEDGNWYDPEGRFDWSAIDRLEVATGSNGLGETVVGLDAIRVVPAPSGEPSLSNDLGAAGLYFDPAASGHGFDFNVLENGLVVYYYGHTADGERLWLISELFTGDLAFGEPVALTVYELPTGTFGAPVEPAMPWGTITMTLDSCTTGSAVFDGLDGQMNMNFVRLADVPGMTCSH